MKKRSTISEMQYFYTVILEVQAADKGKSLLMPCYFPWYLFYTEWTLAPPANGNPGKIRSW